MPPESQVTPPGPTPRTRRVRPKHWLALVAGLPIALIVLYVLAALFLAPRIAPAQLGAYLKSEYGLVASIDSMDFDPMQLRIGAQAGHFSTRDGEVFLEFESLAVDLGLLDLLTGDIVIEEIVSYRPRLHVRIAEDGTSNFALLTSEEGAEEEDDEGQEEEAGDDDSPFSLKRISLKDGIIHFVDLSGPSSVETDLPNVQLDIESEGNFLREPFDASIVARRPDDSTFEITGRVGLDPLTAQVSVELTRWTLGQLGRYSDAKDYPLRVRDGDLSLAAEIDYQTGEAAQTLEMTGKLTLDDLDIDSLTPDEPGVKLESFAIDSIEARVELPEAGGSKVDLQLGQVLLRKPTVGLLVRPDGSIAPFQPPADSADDTPSEPAKTEPQATEDSSSNFEASFAGFSITDGSLHVRDETIETPVEIGLTQIQAKLSAMKLPSSDTSELDLEGVLEEHGHLEIQATGKPMARPLEYAFTIAIEGLEATALSGYSAYYLGREIEKGKIGLDSSYQLEGDVLAGKNKILLDHTTLGGQSVKEAATSLPVGLALSILRDGDGRVVLDIPVQGDIASQGFNIGKLLVEAFSGVILKTIGSPFAIVSGIVDGGEELSTMQFEPGSTKLNKAERKKLKIVAAALAKKPELHLEIAGEVATEADRKALRLIGDGPEQHEALLKLAKERAESIRDFLVDKADVDPNAIYLINRPIDEVATDDTQSRCLLSLAGN